MPKIRAKYLKLLSIALCTLGFLVMSPSSSIAELEDIKFSADHQRQIREDNLTVLTGNVHIEYLEYNIWADQVFFNRERKEFYGVGNVHILGSDREIFADDFWYNYDRDEFIGNNAKGKIAVSGISEPVHFVCKQIKGDLYDYKLISSTLTTCHPDDRQEYHVRANMVKVLPDNKVILRNAFFYLGKIPLFWFPYWQYSLKETPFEVQIGKNRSEGTFVKIKYNYLYATNIVGSMTYHYLSKLGMRFITDHNYYIKGQGRGGTSITWLRKRKSETAGGGNNISFRTNQRFRFSPQLYGDISVTQNRDVDVLSGRSRNDFSSRISLTHDTPSTNTSGNFNYNSQESSTYTSVSSSAQLSHKRRWQKQNLDFNANFNFTRQNPTRPDEQGSTASDLELNSTFTLSKRKNLYDWNVKVEKRFDLDGSRYLGDSNKPYFNRLPEITLNIDPGFFESKKEAGYKEGKSWEGFQMRRIELKGALFYQGPKDQEIQGFFGKYSQDINRDFPLSDSSRITTSLRFLQNITSTGDALFSIAPKIQFRHKFSNDLNMNLNWDKSETKGRSPFRQESGLGSNNNLRWDMSYSGNSWTHRWATGYNINSDRWQNITQNSTYNVGRGRFKYNFSTGYNLERNEWTPINNSISMQDFRNYMTDFSIVYNLEQNKLTTFSNNTKLRIGDDWDVEFQIQYLGSGSKGSLLRQVYVNKRFDCTFIQVSYDASYDSFMITFGITAYPTLSYSYRNNDQGLRNTFPGFGGNLDFSGGGIGGMGGGMPIGGYGGDFY